MKKVFLSALAAAALFLAGAASGSVETAGYGNESHGEVLLRLLDRAASDGAAELLDSDKLGKDGLIVNIDGESLFAGELESILLARLLSSGVVLFDNESTATGDSTACRNLLEVKVVRADVRYPGWSRSFLVGPVRLSCSYEVIILMKLVDGADGRILLTAGAAAESEREIPLRDIERISDKGQWNTGELPEISSPAETVLILVLLLGMAWIFSSGQAG